MHQIHTIVAQFRWAKVFSIRATVSLIMLGLESKIYCMKTASRLGAQLVSSDKWLFISGDGTYGMNNAMLWARTSLLNTVIYTEYVDY